MAQFLRIPSTRATGGWRCRGRASDEGNESRRNLGQRERERASERRVRDILQRGECELLNPDLQRVHFESVGARGL